MIDNLTPREVLAELARGLVCFIMGTGFLAIAALGCIALGARP